MEGVVSGCRQDRSRDGIARWQYEEAYVAMYQK